MSLLGKVFSDVGRAVGGAARTVSKVASAASFIPGFAPITAPLAAATGLISRIAPTTSPIRVPVPSMPQPQYSAQPYSPPVTSVQQAKAGGGLVGDVIGGVIGGVVNRYLPTIPGLAPSGGAGGCGCNGSRGRDPCTHQLMHNQPAPLATFFGGCCPPGRTLRRKPMGRDVCIKTPRMNPFNPRALARADRRITTFARRTAPILRDMGYSLSAHRHVKVKTTRRKRGRG